MTILNMKNINELSLVGREFKILDGDVFANQKNIREALHGAKILVIGGAGSIGRAVTKEIFFNDPAKR